MSTGEVTYPPLDTPKRVAENIWIVDSGPMKAMNVILIPVRMTVIRLANGDLVLHSPTRFTPGLRQELEALGPIRHLVAPNSAHWTFMQSWQEQLPQATTWAAPGLRHRGQVKRSGLRLDHDLSPATPIGQPGEIEQVQVHGIGGFREVCLFHPASRSLIVTDLVQHFEAQKLPGWLRPFARLAGSTGNVGRAPVYLRGIVKGKTGARATAERLLALEPERVIFTHGQWFEENATARLRESLRWML